MAKGRSYMNSSADGYMRGKVVKEVGALLDHILVEEIATPTIINLEFGSAYDTSENLGSKKPQYLLRSSDNSATSLATISTRKYKRWRTTRKM